jgi:ABC-2 type transport system ATP-binding protein
MSLEASPAVRFEGVSVNRGGRPVLRDLSFDLPHGLVVGLIGPSGCGKTTLMRSIVGVQRGVEGSAVVLDRPAGEASRRGQVGYMTQDASVYGDLSVVENLEYFAKLLAVTTPRVEELLQTVRLEDVASVLVDRLSGGQRARVSLAVAMLNQPPLLVLDEPTVGLDPALREELWRHFAEIASQGSTLLVSSHVMDEASRCDQLLLMRAGRILAKDSPQDLMARTGTDTVEAAFLSLVATEDTPT